MHWLQSFVVLLCLQTAAPAVPEEALREIRHRLDSSFVVTRDKVQFELQLTTEQKATLHAALPEFVAFFQHLKTLPQEEQERELKAFKPKAREHLASVLRDNLTAAQRERLLQIQRQRDQLFEAENWKALQVSAAQQQQFMALMQETQKKIKSLLDELQLHHNIYEIQPKVLQARAELESHLEALLTDDQRDQWKVLLGKPMALADIFDM